MSKTFRTILCFILLFQNVLCWRKFWNGRKYEHNINVVSQLASAIKTNNDTWFDQHLDHFDPTNTAIWKQRYFTNDQYYTKGGPIFLMIGGEGEVSASSMHEGAWINYAKEHNALCFHVEHRYYGKSHPTNDSSTKNLVYLSSEQALADLAYFIVAMNDKYNITLDEKWIAFGGSYAGSLAAWLREKYAHLVHGAVSSSGPLLAKADFSEYFDVVGISLGTYSDDCVDAVQKSFAEIDILLKHMIGQQNLNKKFMLCDPIEQSINNSLDISNLFGSLASDFAGVVQYNNDNRKGSVINIDKICDIMVNKTMGPPVDRLAKVNELLLHQQNESCLDYKYDKMILEIQNISWSADIAAMRQWTYQTCTEFGFYQTSSNKQLIFGDAFKLSFFIQQCTDIYGEKFTSNFLDKSIVRTNINYGALKPHTTNVLYVHGSIDPWHALGITKSNNPLIPVIFIQGTAHCADMYEPQPNDIPALKEARVKIDEFIKNLLNTPKKSKLRYILL